MYKVPRFDNSDSGLISLISKPSKDNSLRFCRFPIHVMSVCWLLLSQSIPRLPKLHIGEIETYKSIKERLMDGVRNGNGNSIGG